MYTIHLTFIHDANDLQGDYYVKDDLACCTHCGGRVEELEAAKSG